MNNLTGRMGVSNCLILVEKSDGLLIFGYDKISKGCFTFTNKKSKIQIREDFL